MDDLSGLLQVYLIVVLIWLIVASFTLISIVKRKDIPALNKICWCMLIVLAPVVGLIIYLVYNYNRENKF